MFSDEIVEHFRSVAESESSNFLHLVKLAGLDPTKDLRFANLRGVDLRACDLSNFDLTFADLCGAIISPSTKLPARLPVSAHNNLISADDPIPIHEVMNRIAKSPENSRKKLLSSLSENYSSPRHIDVFCLDLLKKTRTPKYALQYVSAITEKTLHERSPEVINEIIRVLENHALRAAPRKKVGARSEGSEAFDLLEIIADMDAGAISEIAAGHLRSPRTISETLALMRQAT